MLPGVDREPVVVRAAEPGDADQLNEIYNQYVRTSHVTFDNPASVALHRRFGFTEQGRKFGPTGTSLSGDGCPDARDGAGFPAPSRSVAGTGFEPVTSGL